MSTITYAEYRWFCDDCGVDADEPYDTKADAERAAAEHECEADA